MIKIGIVAEYSATYEPDVATSRAIEHSSEELGLAVSFEWISTVDVKEDFFDVYDGLWVAPGSPYKSMDKALRAIREGPIAITGSDAEGEVRVVEYPEHPLFFATLFVPQMLSQPNKPHLLVTAFLRAVSRV